VLFLCVWSYLYVILLINPIRNEVVLAWRMYGRQERRTKGFAGEPEGKKQHGKSRHRWENDIKMDPREVRWGAWTGLVWLRTGTSGGTSCKGNEHSNFIKCEDLLSS